jgi:hypothetical protein
MNNHLTTSLAACELKQNNSRTTPIASSGSLLGALLMLLLCLGLFATTSEAQVPRNISYQAELLSGNARATGLHTFKVIYYDGLGTNLYSETFNSIEVKNGLFTLPLGTLMGGFPVSMSFNQAYSIGISIDGGAELTPRTDLAAAPYAMNAASVNGIGASTIPLAGQLYPLDATAHIDPRVLPQITGAINTINSVGPDGTNDIKIISGPSIQILNDATNHVIQISDTGITAVAAGQGLLGGGTTGKVTLSLGPNSVLGNNIANGAISGSKLDPFLAGLGLYQDANGNLNVGTDNFTLEISNDQVHIKDGGVFTQQLANGSVTASKLANGSVNSSKIDPFSVQVRVTDVAPPGAFIRAINPDGTVLSATVLNDPTLSRTVTGNDLTLGIALGHPNQWTGAQNFAGGASAATLSVSGQSTMGGITNNGVLTNNGNVFVNGGLNATSNSTLSGIIDNGTLTNNGNLIVTGTSDLRGAIKNTQGPITMQGNATLSGSLTSPATGHALGAQGTDGNVLTISGLNGGAATELQVFGDANVSGNFVVGGTTNMQTINATTLNANTVNTTRLGSGGAGQITLTSGINAGAGGSVQLITGGAYTGYTLLSGVVDATSTISNNGTILGGTLSSASIIGSTLNSTTIGAVAPASGAFTTLTSSGNSTLGTGPGVSNTMGAGANSVNSIGSGNTTTNLFGSGTGTSNLIGTGPAAINTIGNITGANTVMGLTNVGSLNANGPKLIINGDVTPGFPAQGDYEMTVNGDAQVTGTMASPNAGFDFITTAVQSLNNVTFNRGVILSGAAGQNNLLVAGNGTFGGLLTSNGGILNNGTLIQNGLSNFNALATMSGVTNNGALLQQGLATFNNSIIGNNSLTMNGASNFNGPVTIVGALVHQGPATFSGPITNNGTLSQVGLATFTNGILNNGSLTQNGLSTFNAPAIFNGITNNGALLQQGLATFNGSIIANNSFTANANSNFNGPVTNNSTLLQNGASTFNAPMLNWSTLTQMGFSFFNSLATMTGIKNTDTLLQLGTSTFQRAVTNYSTLEQTGVANFRSRAFFHAGITDTGTCDFTTTDGPTLSLYYKGTEEQTFPLAIETNGLNGIRIQSDKTSGTGLNEETHFVACYDGAGALRGGIYGEDFNNYTTDPDYILETVWMAVETACKVATLVIQGIEIGKGLLEDVAAGVDAAAAADPFEAPIAAADAAENVAESAFDYAKAAEFIVTAVEMGKIVAAFLVKRQMHIDHLGVQFKSSAGDYAEYLKRENPTEQLYPGDIVGMHDGVISRNTTDAQSIMSITLDPIVLGNMPAAGQEKLYSKVAFLGQVPVKVRGIVHSGDFIIPSGLNNGCGIAISADSITPAQFTLVVGRAWEASDYAGLKYVKVGVGLNAKAMSDIMSHQQSQIDVLKKQVNELQHTSAEVAQIKAKLDQLLAQPRTETHEVMLRSN